MMGRQISNQSQLFFLFNLEERIPARHLLRLINPTVTRVLAGMREKLQPFYSDIGRPSIDAELMIRRLVVAYSYGIRSERKLCEEVELHLAYCWFCRLALDDKVPHHSTFSVNRHGRFRESDLFRQVFEAVVRACMNAGLVKGEGLPFGATTDPCSAWAAKANKRVQFGVAPAPAQRLAYIRSLSPAVAAFRERVIGSACASTFLRLARRSLA